MTEPCITTKYPHNRLWLVKYIHRSGDRAIVHEIFVADANDMGEDDLVAFIGEALNPDEECLGIISYKCYGQVIIKP